MKPLLYVLALTLSMATGYAKPAINHQALADAIFWSEGGHKTKYPYGIKSVRTNGYADARQVCLNTTRNSYNRWSGPVRV